MKKIILVLFISLFLVLPFRVGALELEKSFEKQFDLLPPYYYDYSYDVIDSYDNNDEIDGYLVISKSKEIYIKLDNDDNVIWSKNDSEIRDLISSIKSYTNISRINTDTREVIWEWKYDNSIWGDFYYYFHSYDNDGNLDGYIVFLEAKSVASGVTPGNYMIKFDMNGNIIWKHIIHSYLSYNIGFYSNDYLFNDDNVPMLCSISSSHADTYLKIVNTITNEELYFNGKGYAWSTLAFTIENMKKIIVLYNKERLVYLAKFNADGQEIQNVNLKIPESYLFNFAINVLMERMMDFLLV